MSVFAWPAELTGVTESKFYLRAANLSSTSPFTGQRSAYGPTAQLWVAELQFPALKPENWRRLSAFISRLDGISGLLRMPDSFRKQPLYNIENTPTVGMFSDNTLFSDGTGFIEGQVPAFLAVDEAASAGANFIKVSGLPASVTGILKPGDLLEALPNGQEVAFGHLYEVVQQANSSAAGKAGFEIRPRLRAALAAGDQLKVINASSVFRLAGDQEGIMNRSMPDIGRMGITLIEKLPQ